MQPRTKRLMAAAALGTAVAAGAGITVANNDAADDVGAPITAPDLDRASSAALAHTGEGRVTGTEVGDEESYYEVEVTLGDGRQVDVQLDEAFSVVSATADDAGEDQTGEH